MPFEIPPQPWPPVMLSVSNGAAQVGQPVTITVIARGDLQLLFNEDIEQFEAADPSEVGGCNPAAIRKVRVLYKDAADVDLGFTNYVDLSCVTGCAPSPAGCTDEEGSTWQGRIPASFVTPLDKKIQYIVTVVDSYNNVAVETPDPNHGPATHDNPSSGTWGADSPPLYPLDPYLYQAPFVDNDYPGESACASGNSRYAMCDKIGDAMSFTGGTGPAEVDIKGMNLGVDSNSLYLNMDLNASSIPYRGGYIEVYSFAMFNPDAADPNPYDNQFYKCFSVLYAPETMWGDMSFWDCECLTDPETPDPFGCRITDCYHGTDCVRETVGGKLYFSVKHSHGDNILFGSSSDANQFTKIIAASAQVDLNAYDIFALSDFTRGVGYYRRNHEVTVGPPTVPGPVTITQAYNWMELNHCRINWLPSQDPGVNQYLIYRALSQTAPPEQITKLGAVDYGNVTFTDPEELPGGGETYWYFISAKNQYGQVITPPGSFESDCAGEFCPFSDRWYEVQNAAKSCSVTQTNPVCADPDGRYCISGKLKSKIGLEYIDIDISGGMEIKVYDPAGALLKTVTTAADGSFLIDFNYGAPRAGSRTASAVANGTVVTLKLVPKAGSGLMTNAAVGEVALGSATVSSSPHGHIMVVAATIITDPATQCWAIGDINYTAPETCCAIDGADFTVFKPYYNTDCADPDNCPCDLSEDGRCDAIDFIILKSLYNMDSCD